MAKVTKTQVVKFIRKGEKGDPAVNIIVGSDTVVFTKSGQAAKITLQVFIGDRQLNYGDGTNDTFVCSTLGNSHYILDNNVYWTFKIESDNKTFDYLLSLQNKADLSAVLPFTITVNGISYSKTLTIKTVYDGNKGDKGEQGAVLRGPQAWADCSVGYVFQAGGEDESWKDVVLYNNNYYSCVKSHAKTASNYPGSAADVSNKYWQLGDKIELVATKVLLSEYGVIKNLGAEGITMKDKEGNVVFQAEGGDLTCKTGTFENVDVSGIVHASLMYSSVKSLSEQNTGSSTYNIDPINEPANTFYIVAATGHTKFMNLPDANTYEGLELNFYQAVLTTAGMGDIYVAAASSQYIYYNTVGRLINENTVPVKISPASRDTRIKISANEVIRLKAMNGAWYVMTGLVTEE